MRNQHNHSSCSGTPINLIAQGYEQAFHFSPDNFNFSRCFVEYEKIECRIEVAKLQRVRGWANRIFNQITSKLLSVKPEPI